MAHNFKDKNIGVGITGSYCTYKKVFEELKHLADTKANIITIFSDNAASTPIVTIPDAEPIGPKSMLDLMIIAPCTGNTLSKLANGISDTPVLMAAKAHLRNNRPLVIFLSTNDALGMNLKNIGILLNTKNIYFVPFGQDNYISKPNSMIAHVDLIEETIEKALSGRQIQPVIKSPHVTIM